MTFPNGNIPAHLGDFMPDYSRTGRYFHLGPWAYEKHYADTPPPENLRIPVDTYEVDLTDPVCDE